MTDRSESRAMDLAAFEAAADLYGGDLSRWPGALRAPAEALAAAEPAARGLLEQAALLDALLEASARSAPQPSAALTGRMLKDAEVALGEIVARRAAAPAARSAPAKGVWSGFRDLLSRLGLETAAFGGVGAAAAAGLALGLIAPLETGPSFRSDETSVAAASLLEGFDDASEFDLFTALDEQAAEPS